MGPSCGHVSPSLSHNVGLSDPFQGQITTKLKKKNAHGSSAESLLPQSWHFSAVQFGSVGRYRSSFFLLFLISKNCDAAYWTAGMTMSTQIKRRALLKTIRHRTMKRVYVTWLTPAARALCIARRLFPLGRIERKCL